MRLVTWNCRSGTVRDRATRLSHLRPDIVILQECQQPDLLDAEVPWRGAYPGRGIAVVPSSSAWQVEPAALPHGLHTDVLPVHVSGPLSFNMLGVWTHRMPSYVESLLNALDRCRQFLETGPVVIAGDFNSNARWDTELGAGRNHATLVRRMEDEFGLVSAYHHHRGEPHGAEGQPTYYHLFDQARPFHLDYCFIPSDWAGRLRSVEVAGFDDWQDSDHRPLVVEIAER